MAGTSLFALIDDIAAILDDISLMTKFAAKKTAGVLGDDLALNAQQVAAFIPNANCPLSGPSPAGPSSTKSFSSRRPSPSAPSPPGPSCPADDLSNR